LADSDLSASEYEFEPLTKEEVDSFALLAFNFARLCIAVVGRMTRLCVALAKALSAPLFSVRVGIMPMLGNGTGAGDESRRNRELSMWRMHNKSPMIQEMRANAVFASGILT